MRRKPNNKMNNNNNHHRRRHHNNRGDNFAHKIKAAQANREKYLNLARDAMASGDRVASENFLQHADHYYRVFSYLQEEENKHRAQFERTFAEETETAEDAADSAADDDAAEDEAEEETGNADLALAS